MAQGVLILRVTEGEEGLQQTLDMPQFLQALGHFRQALGNQRLDIFTVVYLAAADKYHRRTL